ncbi:twin-arginine translocase subunit TatC [Kitasatospora sp. NBC_01287]|uniref:twin-arginine translocase subunit TatC n=1 Tax=Kitasatospora sp. NBC_01287 TaxID=2903573 RepID=UPI00224DAC6D|nr:twin-arginine translocase subunit TatC [Kitasatospora sp. NBC_01287]MCX4744581.1 twin-arginine translocase subunit TatC [Kitasatospora sp. NBC_01287]
MKLPGPRADNPHSATMPLGAHLRELRGRLTKVALSLLAGSAAGWLVHAQVIAALTGPACRIEHVHGVGAATPACPNGLLVLQGALAPLSFSFKVALVVGVLLASPLWSYQLWAFVAPGLYRRERRYGLAFAAAAVPLFASGAALAYMVFPKTIELLASFTPVSFGLVLPGDEFLDFFLRMVVVFGLSFQFPLLLVVLNLVGVVSARRLRGWWRIIIFLIFVFAAVVVPTGDPLTMLVLAVPICLLFLVALGICSLHDRRGAVRAAREAATEPPDDQASPAPTADPVERSEFADADR